MADMPRKLPPYVMTERSRHIGSPVRYYFRRFKGPRIRLPDDIDSKEFNDAYLAAYSGRPTNRKELSSVASASWQWLVDRYMESGTWAGLSVATRKQRSNIFKEAIRESKNAAFSDIDQDSMQAAVDRRYETPAQANNLLKAMHGLYAWALKNRHVTSDPTVGVERLKYKSDGFEAWTMDDLKQFYAHWAIGTKPRLAAELIINSGLRRSDVVRAGKQHLRGDIFSMKTMKTGATITVEFPPSLVDTIAETPVGDMAFLVSERGTPFTKESFGNWFRVQCDKAGIEKSAHGIRKLSATLAANGGAAAHELMAQYGWTNVKQAEIYTKGVDRKMLGIKSSKRIADQIENEMPLTSNPVRGLAKKT